MRNESQKRFGAENHRFSGKNTRNALEGLNRRDQRRKEKLDLRSQVISQQKNTEPGAIHDKVQAFEPSLQQYVKELEASFTPEQLTIAQETIITPEIAPRFVAVLDKELSKQAITPAVKQEVRAKAEATAKNEQDFFSWMEVIVDFLSSKRIMKPAALAMVIMVLFTACAPTPAPEVNAADNDPAVEAPAGDLATLERESVDGVSSSTNDEPGLSAADATAEAEERLTAADIQAVIDEEAAAQAETTALRYEELDLGENFARELYELDYISPDTNMEILFHPRSGRPFVHLLEPSPYGNDVYLTPGVSSGILFISGESLGVENIRIGDEHLMVGEVGGETYAVDAQDGTWKPIAEASEESVTVVELPMTETAIGVIDGTIAYPEHYENSQRAELALAITAELEQRRGEEALSFEHEGTTYFYNPEISSVEDRWVDAGDSEATRERATIPLYIPIYRNKDNGNIMYYWNGSWSEAPDSGEVDYTHLINKNNMTDGTIDVTSNTMQWIMDNFDITYIPIIMLDDETSEAELFPVIKESKGLSGAVFYGRFDTLLVGPDSLYGVNAKFVSATFNNVFYPGTQDEESFQAVQHITRGYDGLFTEGNTYYVGIPRDHNQTFKDFEYSTPIVDGVVNTDEYLSDPDSFWESLRDASFVSIRPSGFFDPN